MRDLPDSAWGFANIEQQTAQRNVSQAVAVLYVVEYTGELQAIGACFRVCHTTQCAVWVTASHVIEHAAKIAAPHYLSERPLHEWTNNEFLNVSKRMCLYWSNLAFGPIPCVTSFYAAPSIDLACVIAVLPEQAAGLLTPPLVINSDLLQSETKILAAVPSKLAPDNAAMDRYEVEPELHLRFGKITGGPVNARLIGAPIYEASIPFRPGMSGSPVFAQPEGSRTLCIIGVVSSDLSSEEAHAKPGTAGYSCVIPIGYAYALRLGSLQLPNGADTFDAFCADHAITDLGTQRTKIRVTRTGDNWRVWLP